MADKYKVLSNYTIWVRTHPKGNATAIGIIKGGQTITALDVQDGWIKHDKLGKVGWSIMRADGKLLIEKISSSSVKSAKKQDEKNDKKTKKVPKTDKGKTLQEIKVSASKVTRSSISTNFIKSTRGVYGIPYQFMPSVDRRPSGSTFGRKYIDKVIANMPLLLISPGKPKFMKAFSIKEKKDIIRYIKSKDTNYVNNLINGSGRYYSFEFNYKEFYQILNPMAQMMARYLNIQDEKIDNTRLDSYKWQNYTNSAFKTFISAAESLAFYIDSENQITESFSNSTGESMLANQTNQLSDTARELQFLLGGVSGAEFDKLNADAHDEVLKQFNDFTNKYFSKLNPGGLITRLQSGLLTVATGGKLIFPEIWNDSSFSKSYSISMKLRTPDSDNLSWFLNIGLPMLVWLALTAPQQMDANSYKSPFLIRAYYKGFFNIEMGIITGLSFNKGNSTKWTANGLPTEVDVSVDMKDLYDVLMVTQSKSEGIISGARKIINNTYLMDYLANMCGINISKPDIKRTIDIYKQTILNNITDKLFYDRWLGLRQSVTNLIGNIVMK